MSVSNGRLMREAYRNKNDEFYTRYEDIENEMQYYTEYFEDKIVYCNCDNFEHSNFFKYFYDNFFKLKLKGLIATYYDVENKPVKAEFFRNYKNIELNTMLGNGDFRSDECVEILKRCDIVVTNPPFSLSREHLRLIDTHNKKFIVIGNQNITSNNDVLDLFKANRIWFGKGFKNRVGFFINEHYEDYALANEHKDGMIRVSGVCWFTNIKYDGQSQHFFGLYDKYAKYNNTYEKYDNYDAININKVKDIPCDYYGTMGVPITFLSKYNPNEFDIIGLDKDFTDDKKRCKINGKTLYTRIFIKRHI